MQASTTIHFVETTSYASLTPLAYGIATTPFGYLLIVWGVDHTVCRSVFISNDFNTEISRQEKEMNISLTHRDDTRAQNIIERLLNHKGTIKVALMGTAFQQQVWKTIAHIPSGTTLSYLALAQAIGMPRAVRAVANAVGRNRLALVIPCHRIICNNGSIGGYAWGTSRKTQILTAERNGITEKQSKHITQSIPAID